MNEKNNFDLSAFFFRVLPAVSGALLGGILALGFFFALKMAAGSGAGDPTLFSGFALFATVFIAAMAGNLLAAIFSVVAAGEHFSRAFQKTLMNIFFAILLFFGVSAPFFLLLKGDAAFSLTQFLLPFSAVATALFLALFRNSKNPEIAAHTALFPAMMVAGLFAILFPAIIPSEMLPFFAIPISWLFLAIFGFFIEKIFSLFQKEK